MQKTKCKKRLKSFNRISLKCEPGALILGPPILKLAGVMSGTFLDIQPIRALETARIAVAPSNMGIAAVVPAYKVMEILASPELSARLQRK